jgi:hypothetical protein
MGNSLSWLAVKGKSPETVLGQLELRSTRKPGEVGRAPFVAATSDAGWYLVVANRCAHHIISAPVVESLSADCELLTCTVEEHVMFSEATGWRGGQRLWSVTHRGDDDATKKTVAEQGTLPSEYPAIRDRFFSQQEAENAADAEVDFLFEIPVVLVQTFTGFKHDDASPAFEARGFELLESTKRSFFQRLFSK